MTRRDQPNELSCDYSANSSWRRGNNFAAKVPFAWTTADEAYGQVKYLRLWLEAHDAAHVLATKVHDTLITTGGREAPPAGAILRPPLLSARARAVDGDRDAHEALLEMVRLAADDLHRYPQTRGELPPLQEAMLSDGYEIRWDEPDLMPTGSQGCKLVPIDPDAIPVSTEITALEAELDARGYTEAREHYRLAVKHFTEQDHPSANGQLRNMVESLIIRLAVDHASYVDTGKANQGGQAIKTLYVAGGKPPAVIGLPLPERDGGGMLQGIWDVLHSNGPHPGLSDADEARLRMQLCTGLARFLLKHFPARP